MLKNPSLRSLLPRLGLVLALAPFLLLCAFDQPFFDDFRNGTWMREHGTWGVQLWLFRTWTGRFTTTFIMTVLNPVAYGWLDGVKLVTAGLFVAQWASLAHLLRALRRLPPGPDEQREDRHPWRGFGPGAAARGVRPDHGADGGVRPVSAAPGRPRRPRPGLVTGR